MNKKTRVLPSSIILLILVGVVFILSYYYLQEDSPNYEEYEEPSIQYDNGEWTDLDVYVISSEDLRNLNDICYKLTYLPDEESARSMGGFVWDYYANRVPGIFGDTLISKGETSWKVYMTQGDDIINIKFEDGTEENRTLYKGLKDTMLFKKSDNYTATYDCYFDGQLRHSNLTYPQLKNYTCDAYKLNCDDLK